MNIGKGINRNQIFGEDRGHHISEEARYNFVTYLRVESAITLIQKIMNPKKNFIKGFFKKARDGGLTSLVYEF